VIRRLLPALAALTATALTAVTLTLTAGPSAARTAGPAAARAAAPSAARAAAPSAARTAAPSAHGLRTEVGSQLLFGAARRSDPRTLRDRVARGLPLDGTGWYTARPAPATPAQTARFRRVTQGTYPVRIASLPDPATADGATPRIALDPISVQECWQKATARGSGERLENVPGWVKNHYAWCSSVPIAILNIVRVIDLGDPGDLFQTRVYTATARLTVIGQGSPDDRRVTFRMGIDQAHKDDDFGDLTLNFTAGCDAGPVPCPSTGDTSRDLALEDWNKLGPQGTAFSFSTPADQGQGIARKAEAVFRTALQGYTVGGLFDQTTDFLTAPMDGPRTTVRFDSAAYMRRDQWAIGGQGAIFDNVVPHLIYSRSASEQDVATHIDDALHHPGSTYPPDPGKRIPGGSADQPLHRLLSKDWTPVEDGDDPTANPRYNRNRSVVRAACRQLRKDQPPVGVLRPQCDEFPFASTYEGAAASEYQDGYPYGFSVRYIPGSSNEAGGGKLVYWYYSDRILDSDPFYVQIIP
jgi:hypothetical protein